jgi:ATP-dependent Clp protease ATP-binding subunit ClpA
VREVFSLISGVPVNDVKKEVDDVKRYLNMESELNKVIINQEEAIEAISNVIKRKKAGIDDESKPNVMFFAGSTGTGKTHTAKELSKFLFGEQGKMLFLNGAEYGDQTGGNRLTGGNPGYVGYGEATDFEFVRNNPYCVVLIDECEKMHPSVWKTFLRIFDEGELKTANNKNINFKNCIFILTSNIGSVQSARGSVGLELGDEIDLAQDRKQKYETAVKKYFKPELYNRLSKIVIFNDLTRNDLNRIVTLELKPLTNKLKNKGIRLSVAKRAQEYLIDSTGDKKGVYGARPLKRSIEKNINDKLADIILAQDEIKTISVTVKNKELQITAK